MQVIFLFESFSEMIFLTKWSRISRCKLGKNIAHYAISCNGKNKMHAATKLLKNL